MGLVSEALVACFEGRGIGAVLTGQLPENSCSYFYQGFNGPVDGDQTYSLNFEAFSVAEPFYSYKHEGGGFLVMLQDTGGDLEAGRVLRDTILTPGTSCCLNPPCRAAGWKLKSIDMERVIWLEIRLKDFRAYLGGDDRQVFADGKRLPYLKASLPSGNPEDLPVPEKGVIVVSGGARGVTAAVVRAMAAKDPTASCCGRTFMRKSEVLQRLCG